MVRYGHDPYWSDQIDVGKDYGGSIACKNSVFGDPYWGKGKTCECMVNIAITNEDMDKIVGAPQVINSSSSTLSKGYIQLYID